MRFSSCENEGDNFRVSHGKQIRPKYKESFESKVLKQSNFALQSPLPSSFRKLPIKGTGSRNRKQTRDLYNLYCCPHVAIVFCTDAGGWGESTRKLLPKIHQYLRNRATYECFVCFSSKLKSPFSK